MSGLARVLAGRTPAAVYRWSSHARTADVAHAVEHARWRFVLLDTARVEDEAGFLAESQAAFGFPDAAARDLDALAAALSGVAHENGTLTLWEGWSPFARAQPEQFAGVLRVLTGRCARGRGGAFVVVLRGDGPPLRIPDLDPHGGGGG
jgi:RNAse (barnase) inhibitor barstar